MIPLARSLARMLKQNPFAPSLYSSLLTAALWFLPGAAQSGPLIAFLERAQCSLAVCEVHDGLSTRGWYHPAVK